MIKSGSVVELQKKRFLLAHSNVGDFLHQWHDRRKAWALLLGYNVTNFSISEYLPPTIFPYLDRMWRKRDRKLMNLYEALGKRIEECDIFIHYNGAMIHPEFLDQFKKIKVYHCADDPDSSKVLSRPVAPHYDVCAISNPACMNMYKEWGCKNVFFWPLGAFHYRDDLDAQVIENTARDIPLVFVGSKYGVPRFRFIGKYLGLYRKKKFMQRIEYSFPEMVGYGGHWANGYIADDLIPELYMRSKIGLNVHNSLGPINSRLYDLAAFGVLQVCDNKSGLNRVFSEGDEIVGFETIQECVDRIRYYLDHPDEARRIALAGRQRYLRDYTMSAIWNGFFNNLSRILAPRDSSELFSFLKRQPYSTQ